MPTINVYRAPALRATQTLARGMAGHMGAPVRRSFMRRGDAQRRTPHEELMTSTRHVAGGRGGRGRRALLLSLWWVNARADQDGDGYFRIPEQLWTTGS